MDHLFTENSKIIDNVASNTYSLVNNLAAPNTKLCSQFKKNIKIKKQIGKGNYGTIYTITVKNKGEKNYVIKALNAEVEKYKTTWDVLEKVGYSRSLISAYNPRAKPGDKQQIFLVPVFAKECLIPAGRRKIYDPIPKNEYDPNEEPLVVAGIAHICDNNVYSEFYIGALLGRSYQIFECINFFDVYSMFTCSKSKLNKKRYRQIILMDRIDGEWGDGANCCNVSGYLPRISKRYNHLIVQGIFLQLMFAIAFYQDRYQISHNDLHTGNLFVEYVTDKTVFNDQFLIEAEWYHYHLSEKDGKKACDLYFPAIPVIAKIGDFGLSVKYSEPIVGDQTVFETGYDQNDGDGPWIPNQYYPTYDSVYAASSYIRNLKIIDPELDQMVCYLFGIKKVKQLRTCIKETNGRPYLDQLSFYHTAEDLLRSPLVVSRYGKKPDTVSATLGVL